MMTGAIEVFAGDDCMGIAKWDDSYKTGVYLIDGQHQQLFQMVNDLHEAMLAEKEQEIMMSLLERLS